MGAIMAEKLSKTAKASMVKEVKQVRTETPEEALRQLRLNLDAGLFVTPDRIRILLSAYDAAKAEIIQQARAGALVDGKSYRVTRVHDEISLEEIEDAYPPRPMPGSGE